MNRTEFEEWWFEGGEELAIEKFHNKVSDSDIKLQPSYLWCRNKENAFIEAIWDLAFKWKKVKE
jgi:hypothetical protein